MGRRSERRPDPAGLARRRWVDVAGRRGETTVQVLTWVLFACVLGLEAVTLALLVRMRSRETAGETERLLARTREEMLQAVTSLVRDLREESLREARTGREEMAHNLTRMGDQVRGTMIEQFGLQAGQLKQLTDTLSQQLAQLTQMNESKLERVRGVVEERLGKLQEENAAKLEQMRQTVDEKLQATLEVRLTESFRQVSERLEAVHQGLGEMQRLVSDVSDLRRVLSNVKTRGTFGEVQLNMLLEQTLSPEQYAVNVATKRGSSDRVEFAIKLPGRDEERSPVYLPIDCKFPMEDYERLMEAQDRADAEAAAEFSKALVGRIRSEARTIAQKYIDPPHTTDFAILYLPIEGLFAEVLRHPGLMETLQQDFHVVVSGPTTLTALLTSLQMGFRTLAIQQRSSEVWELLGAVKTQFGLFGDLLAKTKKKLDEASHSIDDAARRSRTIERKLRSVEALPQPQADAVLPADLLADEADREAGGSV